LLRPALSRAYRLCAFSGMASKPNVGEVGCLVWIPCSDLKHGAFSVGQITAIEGGMASVLCESPSCDAGATRCILLGDLRPRFALDTTCADSTALVHMNDAAILDNLKRRHGQDNIYTYTASVLLAVNPYKRIEALYGEDQCERYKGKHIGALPPHPYAIADTSYRLLHREKKNQAILISGESGAGKTETAKIVMQHLAHASGTGSAKASSIQDRVLKAQPILESFGNAATLRNSNSSRFGKYNRLFFDDTGLLIDAGITTYLLESSRVVAHAERERTYHVLYEMLSGADDAMLQRFHLERTFPYRLLHSTGKPLEGFQESDKENYHRLREAMKTVGLSDDQIDGTLQILAGLVHLGDIAIEDNSGAVQMVKAPRENSPDNEEVQLDENRLHWAAELLGIDALELGGTLKRRRIKVPGRKSVLEVSRTTSLFKQALHSFIKAIYKRLFDQIVDIINASFKDGALLPQDDDDVDLSDVANSRKHIGILDIYGFERLQKNSFEQLCINLANERLQQCFVENVLKAEQELYKREALEWKDLAVPDSTPVLTCISYIFNQLDDFSSRLARGLEKDGTDERFCEKVTTEATKDPSMAQVLKRPAVGGAGRSRRLTAAPTSLNEFFTVKHYAGIVEYSTTGWLNKNNDRLLAECEELIADSSSHAVKALADDEDDENRQKAQFRSISKKYMIDLQALLTTLDSSSLHYIRCFKPNEKKKPRIFEEEMVLDQIVQCGTIELVKIMHDGYPNRCLFGEVEDRFKKMLPDSFQRYGTRTFIEALMLAYDVPPDEWALGMSRLFLKAGQLQKLENMRSEGATPSADKLKAIVSAIIRKRWMRAIHAARFCNYVPKLIANFKVQRAARELAKHHLLVSRLAPRLEAAKQRLIARKLKARRKLVGCFRLVLFSLAAGQSIRRQRKERVEAALFKAARIVTITRRWVELGRARALEAKDSREAERRRLEDERKRFEVERKHFEEQRKQLEEEARLRREDEDRQKAADEDRRRKEAEQRILEEEELRRKEEERTRLEEEKRRQEQEKEAQRLREQEELEAKRKREEEDRIKVEDIRRRAEENARKEEEVEQERSRVAVERKKLDDDKADFEKQHLEATLKLQASPMQQRSSCHGQHRSEEGSTEGTGLTEDDGITPMDSVSCVHPPTAKIQSEMESLREQMLAMQATMEQMQRQSTDIQRQGMEQSKCVQSDKEDSYDISHLNCTPERKVKDEAKQINSGSQSQFQLTEPSIPEADGSPSRGSSPLLPSTPHEDADQESQSASRIAKARDSLTPSSKMCLSVRTCPELTDATDATKERRNTIVKEGLTSGLSAENKRNRFHREWFAQQRSFLQEDLQMNTGAAKAASGRQGPAPSLALAPLPPQRNTARRLEDQFGAVSAAPQPKFHYSSRPVSDAP